MLCLSLIGLQVEGCTLHGIQFKSWDQQLLSVSVKALVHFSNLFVCSFLLHQEKYFQSRLAFDNAHQIKYALSHNSTKALFLRLTGGITHTLNRVLQKLLGRPFASNTSYHAGSIHVRYVHIASPLITRWLCWCCQ